MGKEVFESFRPGHQRLVCIDSDGCAFDTMEIKHKGSLPTMSGSLRQEGRS